MKRKIICIFMVLILCTINVHKADAKDFFNDISSNNIFYKLSNENNLKESLKKNNNMCTKNNINTHSISIKENEISNYETRYRIEIDVEGTKMYLYELQNNMCKKIQEYKVSTARKGIERPKGSGFIIKIELNPWWFPTNETKRYLKETKNLDIPDAVPPGNKLNFMGTFKMHLTHKTSKGNIYRIHGNNHEQQIGKRVTGGCVRMYNDEGEILSRFFIQQIKEKKKIEVEFIT